MSAQPDPRRHAYRPDLAAAGLRGVVDAGRFVEGTPHRVVAGRAPLRGEPAAEARQASELIHGDGFIVYDRRDGWLWGQSEVDGYVGWIEAAALRAGAPTAATHVVADLRGFLFPAPDLKTPPLDALPLGARCTAVEERAGYARLADGGWVHTAHLRPPEHRVGDPLATAERLLGVPYLWGGGTPWGIDCSGLVQLALRLAGLDCPRDSDMQREELGLLLVRDRVPVDCRRGDLVFFPGHVGIMRDATHLLHATAFTMTVTVEPLDEVAARAGGVLAVRRLPEQA